MNKTTCNGAARRPHRVFKDKKIRYFSFLQPRMKCSVFNNLSVYKNGKLVCVKHSRKSAIEYIASHEEPNSVFHIRIANKLVYFKEYGNEQVFLNGFHITNPVLKPFPHTLADLESFTSKDKTLRYEAIAFALEQAANEKQGVQ